MASLNNSNFHTTGAAVCLIVLGMAVLMIARSTRQLKKQENEG